MTMGRGKVPVRRAWTVLMAGVKVHCLQGSFQLRNNIAGIPLGNECRTQASGAATQRCSSGTECLPWTPGGGSWDGTSPHYCLRPQPPAHLESCNYTERRQPCDTGLMCEQGVLLELTNTSGMKLNPIRTGLGNIIKMK